MEKFTKLIRKIRIDNDEVLYDMAKKLNMSTAYLSSIENKRRPIPSDFLKQISEVYKLSDEQQKELQEAIAEKIETVSIDISSASLNKKNLAMSFNREFDTMDEEIAKQISELLNNDKNKKGEE
ncbi:MAG: helix-turn-helix domain-containing protein [Mycoplasmataceae bacterium]|jgi:transcriptional regulator with XRE-family HTH domain|nr:helix-turn-helix domain-containing protein [Mycoplasmataceae bacterium]